jgi:hypothetical protein
MSKKTIGAMVVGVVLLIAGGATAGLKLSYGLRIARFSDGGSAGSGSFPNARTSTYATAQIRCASYPTYAYCGIYSGVTGGDYVACTTYDPNMIGVIRSMNSDANISISVDTLGNCTSIASFNDSAYAPKAP